MGRPLQTSLDAPAPPVPALLVEPAVGPRPALADEPPELAEPPLVECVPAAAGPPGWTVLPSSELHALAAPTSKVTIKAMELGRVRMFPHFTVGQPYTTSMRLAPSRSTRSQESPASTSVVGASRLMSQPLPSANGTISQSTATLTSFFSGA